ncbi:MAG: DUF222 domain-containing protein [Actinomycetota bacterium]|nr:DUF222 domain-containing protein [Actinomycetota bacterium]
MKSSILDREVKVLGETADRDLTSQLQDHLDGMFDDELTESVVSMKRLIDASNAQFLVMVAEMDRREIPQTEYGLSTSAWLMHSCRMAATEASGTVKTARALAQMPEVAKEAVEGNITPNGVRLLAKLRDKHPDEFSDHESVFADIATYLDPRELRQAVSLWEQQVNYAGALADADSARERRRFYFHQSYEGMWVTSGDIDPESGHVISTALRSHTDPANLDRDDNRSMPQRNADALTDICRFWLDHNDDIAIAGGERPHITVTVPYEILTGKERRLGEINGNAVNPETIRRLGCDSSIVRIVTDGDSQPLDVGRRVRTVTPAMRRALELRDGGCTWAGCTAPASWCDAHHIIHWADGGVTALINLILLCRKHHTAIHNGKHPPDR